MLLHDGANTWATATMMPLFPSRVFSKYHNAVSFFETATLMRLSVAAPLPNRAMTAPVAADRTMYYDTTATISITRKN
jgi:hypothetical protein